VEQPTSAGELAELFKALSADTRIRILRLLRDGPLCVNALAYRLGVTHSAVSQHLRVLRAARLVPSDKQGYFVHYRLNDEAIGQLREALSHVLDE